MKRICSILFTGILALGLFFTSTVNVNADEITSASASVLADGEYSVGVELWKAPDATTKSMAAPLLDPNAKIIVSGGNAVLQVSFVEGKIMGIQAYVEDMHYYKTKEDMTSKDKVKSAVNVIDYYTTANGDMVKTVQIPMTVANAHIYVGVKAYVMADAIIEIDYKDVLTKPDKTALQSKIAEAKELSASVYTIESFAAFQSELASAETVNANANATQTQIDNALHALTTALNNLVVVEVKPSEMDNGIYNVSLSFTTTDGGVKTMFTSYLDVDNAKLIVENGVHKLQVSTKEFKNVLFGASHTVDFGTYPTLADAIAKTNFKSGTIISNKETLQGEKAAVIETIIDNPDGENYVGITFDFEKRDVDGTNEGIITIEYKEAIPTVNRSDLKKSIQDAEALNASDYSNKSFAALQVALAQAKEVLAKVDATQEEVDAATTELNLAESNLVASIKDGTYELPVNLWNATADEPSKADSALEDKARVVVEDGIGTFYIYTKEMNTMGITAYIQDLLIQNGITTFSGTDVYNSAEVVSRDANGNPTVFKFKLAVGDTFVNAKVDPKISGMPHAMGVRLKFDYNSLTPFSGDLTTYVQSEESIDGTYELPVALWNATEDKASMAAVAVDETAKIVIKDGKATAYISTKEMFFSPTLSAYLQELKISNGDGTYTQANVSARNANGDPIGFNFPITMSTTVTYLDVLTNPKVAMMGNADIPARLKFDFTKIKKISNDTTAPITTETKANAPSKGVNTSDTTNMLMLCAMAIVSAAIILRKKEA